MYDLKLYAPLLAPITFVLGWMTVTALLGLLSGWYSLMSKFPNNDETSLLQLHNQSGMMGTVGMGRVLKIAVCPSGLRIGIMRIFGLFSRDFFVPWQDINVKRKDRFFWQAAVLRFGNAGALSIAAHVADKLARSAQGRWPEPGTFPEESKSQAFIAIFKQWILGTSLAASFFILVPRIVFRPGSPGSFGPPISVAVLFPATVFGIGCLIQYFQRIKKQ